MMQYSTFSYRKKAVPVKTISWLLKGIVLLLMVYFIHLKVQQGHLSFQQMGLFGLSLYAQHSLYLLLLPLLLVPLNWGLEARKWQLLSAPVSPISMRGAMQAVLTGLSLGFVTPRSLGDYAGRMLEAEDKGRERLVGAVFLNRLVQSLPTYFFGLVALLFLREHLSVGMQAYWFWLIPLLVAAPLAILVMLGKGRYWLLLQIKGYKGRIGSLLWQMFRVLQAYTSREIMLLILYASLRYVVFSFQFVWVLWLAELGLPIPLLMAGVAVVYLIKSLIPTFNFLSDLGVREFSALWVFSGFALPENQLLMASLVLWCMNILLPALLGTVNVLRLRLSRI